MSQASPTWSSELADLAVEAPEPGIDASLVVAPETIEETARVLTVAAAHGVRVVPFGSGSTLHGTDIALSTENLAGIIDYQPDDLTLVVGAGTRLVDIEAELAERYHTAVLPETSPDWTIGGVVASGVSGYRRLKYGPTRDRVLEVTMATGYGEVVRAGGRLVKNVTGYDLSRLVTGSFGSLGIIGSVCLKLWPEPAVRRTVFVEDAGVAFGELYKPVGVLETSTGSAVYLEGDEATVDRQAAMLGGDMFDGFVWPNSPDTQTHVSIRVPPRHISTGIKLADGFSPEWFVGQHGVGIVQMGLPEIDLEAARRLRHTIEGLGGSVVIAGDDLTSEQRWGVRPSSISIQRRMKELFDPAGICNPGVLPGGL